jgi:hypothetical protein
MAVCEQRALAYIGQLNTTTITRSSTRVRHTGVHEVLLCPPSALSWASPTSLSPACSCGRGGEVTLCVSTEQLAHARTYARTLARTRTHARTMSHHVPNDAAPSQPYHCWCWCEHHHHRQCQHQQRLQFRHLFSRAFWDHQHHDHQQFLA